jgi:RHS repeat-associated protein
MGALRSVLEFDECISNRRSRPTWNRTKYSYDSLQRLTSSITPDESFSYDPVGNRTDSGQQVDADNRLLSDGEYIYTYDSDGNQLSKQSKKTGERIEYTWNVEDQLVGVNIKADGTNISKQIMYTYDGLSRRIQKSVTDVTTPTNSYTRRYVFDDKKIIEELDSNNNVVATYLYGAGTNDPLVMMRDINGDGNFDPATEVFYFTKDQLGSIRDMTDSSGTLQQRYRYTAYGVTKIERDQGTGIAQKFIEQPFGYTGGILEPETGETQLGARFLDSTSGRWLSQDPIGFAGENTNLYAYTWNNPINYVDPAGNVGIGTIIGGLGGIVVGGGGPIAVGGILTDIGITGIGGIITGIALPGGILGGAIGAGIGSVSTANGGIPGLPGSPNSSSANPGIPGLPGSGGSGEPNSCPK